MTKELKMTWRRKVYLKIDKLVMYLFPQLHVVYAKRKYPYSWKYLWETWRVSHARPSSHDMFEVTKAVDFYSRLARRKYTELGLRKGTRK